MWVVGWVVVLWVVVVVVVVWVVVVEWGVVSFVFQAVVEEIETWAEQQHQQQ